MLAAALVLLLLARIPQSSARWYPWGPPYHVHVVNELSDNKVLFVQCHCTHGYRPSGHVPAGTEYDWTFKPHFLKETLWQCYMNPDFHHHLNFVAYDRNTIDYNKNVYWIAKDDGVYWRIPDGSPDTLRYKWHDGL
ncbi:S-protein homolog 1 [Linum perenne]